MTKLEMRAVLAAKAAHEALQTEISSRKILCVGWFIIGCMCGTFMLAVALTLTESCL